MEVVFLDKAWEDYMYWKSQDKKILKKLNNLIKDIKRNPFDDIGFPEPLKHELFGFWSRIITLEHRLIYEITKDNRLRIVQCRYHY